MFKKNLFTTNKLLYTRGERPKVDCILCAISEKTNIVTNLTVYETDLMIISINLYPYNTGHLMIFPRRHLIDIREYSKDEMVEVEKLTHTAMNVLDSVYHPRGYNIGYNIGQDSGASIPHIHRHIIPRYQNEIGVIDIIGGAKIIVEDPVVTRDKLKKEFLNKVNL
jgi:ATP adenylyltransferase